MRVQAALPIAAAVAVFALAAPAHADAEQHVQAAKKAERHGEWSRALQAWKAAYAADGNAEHLISIGDAYSHLGNGEEAKKNYEAYAADPLALPENVAKVKKKIASLEAAPAGLALPGPGLALPGSAPAAAPLPLPGAAVATSGLELPVGDAGKHGKKKGTQVAALALPGAAPGLELPGAAPAAKTEPLGLPMDPPAAPKKEEKTVAALDLPVPAAKPAPLPLPAAEPKVAGLDLPGTKPAPLDLPVAKPAPQPEKKVALLDLPGTKPAPLELPVTKPAPQPEKKVASLDLPATKVAEKPKQVVTQTPKPAPTKAVAIATPPAQRPEVKPAPRTVPDTALAAVPTPLPTASSGNSHTFGWLAAGVAVAALGGGAFAYTQAGSAHTALTGSVHDGATAQGLLESEKRNKTLSFVGLAGGLVAGGLAAAAFAF